MAERISMFAQICGHVETLARRLRAVEERAPVPGPAGRDGVGVEEVRNEAGHCIFALSDGRAIDLGDIRGANGIDGQPGENGRDGADGAPGAVGRGVSAALIDRDGALVVTFSDGAVENLGEIVGRDGLDGKDGAAGEAGRDGEPGRDGAPGRDGTDGVSGADGRDGRDGLDGAAGRGIVAARIDDGRLVLGFTDGEETDLGIVAGRDGADGAPGRDGVDGLPGAAGVDGRDGRDGIDGRNGPDGPVGLPGRDGTDGQSGIDGKDGVDGRDGADGKDGRGISGISRSQDGVVEVALSDGSVLTFECRDGRDGVDGRDGRDGIDGTAGAAGRDGIDGRDGAEGAPGRDGISVVKAEIGQSGAQKGILSLTLSDGAVIEAGPVIGAAGEPGRDGRDADPSAIEDLRRALEEIGSKLAARADDSSLQPDLTDDEFMQRVSALMGDA